MKEAKFITYYFTSDFAGYCNSTRTVREFKLRTYFKELYKSDRKEY